MKVTPDLKPCPFCGGKSRDALAYIKQLESENERLQRYYDAEVDRAAEAHHSMREAESSVPRWISVEERLPDNRHDWVLIIGKWVQEGGWIVPHVAEYREGVWLTNDTGWSKIEDLHVKVTHWMPLPEPQEEVRHE